MVISFSQLLSILSLIYRADLLNKGVNINE